MPSDFPFPPVRDAVILVVAFAGLVAAGVHGIRYLIQRARR